MGDFSLHGIDFSSTPSRRKPIVIAHGAWQASQPDRIALLGFTRLDALEAFAQWLLQPGPWLGVFDLPFSLPRELINALGWPGHDGDDAPMPWKRLMTHLQTLSRAELRAVFHVA